MLKHNPGMIIQEGGCGLAIYILQYLQYMFMGLWRIVSLLRATSILFRFMNYDVYNIMSLNIFFLFIDAIPEGLNLYKVLY